MCVVVSKYLRLVDLPVLDDPQLVTHGRDEMLIMAHLPVRQPWQQYSTMQGNRAIQEY